MPRIAGIYSPPYEPVVTATPIESVEYNGYVADVTVDLNAPRPIVAGGTGANNALDARNNIDAEVSGAQVTNYDSHVFENGSFYSLPAATGAPTGNGAAGIFYSHNDVGYATIEARDMVTGIQYVRNKAGGTWGDWKQQVGPITDVTADFVNVTGDTMAGALAISDTTASTSINTGALVVAGGVGVGGDLVLSLDQTYSALCLGGAQDQPGVHSIGRNAVDGSMYIGNGQANIEFSANNVVKVKNTTASTSPTTGALTVAGGVGVGEQVTIGTKIGFSPHNTSGPDFSPQHIDLHTGSYGFGVSGGQLNYCTGGVHSFNLANTQLVTIDGSAMRVLHATATTAPYTGALTVAGGLGVSGDIQVGGNIKPSGVMFHGTGTDLNTSFTDTSVGAYRLAGECSAVTNAPTPAGWWFVENFRHSNTVYGNQIAYGWAGNDDEIYIRTNNGGTWTTWARVATSKNISAVMPLAHTFARPANPVNFTSVVVMQGLGSSCTITPLSTGRVHAIMNASMAGSVPCSIAVEFRYGTGTAPPVGAAATGTVLGTATCYIALNGASTPVTLQGYAALSVGVAYWFDFTGWANNSASGNTTQISFTAIEVL